METACKFFFDCLREPAPQGLLKLQVADRSRDEPFSLSEVLAFLPDRRHAELAELLTNALEPCVQNFTSANPRVDTDHEFIADITTHIVWLLVQARKRPPVNEIRTLILLFHSIIMKLPTRRPQNTISLTCEWLWSINDPERRSIISRTVLYLLLRSFGNESCFINGKKDTTVTKDDNGLPSTQQRRTCTGFVRRLYAMRRALWDVDFSPDNSGSSTFSTLLLRCATSLTYMAEPEGRKLVAYVLTLEEVRDKMLDALINQLSIIRKSRSPLIGDLLLHAWTKNRSDWLADRLIRVAEQAILAKRDPFASNLRMVLANFHLNKKLAGIDVLLHRMYTPILFGNLFVANPIVRRNAVNILADAFPINDPGSPLEEIEAALQMQSSKLLELLTDDAPIVRQAAVQGTCRVLGMMWEIMPGVTPKKMVDVITTKLAFDMSSTAVRVAVYNGLRFMMDNHLIYPVLSVALRPLARFIRDPVEKVRLVGLDLLLKVKSKRLKTLRFFDIVPVNEIINMLSTEPEHIALKAMKLIVTRYFPVERTDSSPEHITADQVKGCLSMLDQNPEAASFFYSHVNMFIPPRPLCEFALRLSAIAFETEPATGKSSKAPTKRTARGRKKSTQKTKTKIATTSADKKEENAEPDTLESNASEEMAKGRKEKLLRIVSDILQSIRPSLSKEKNSSLRSYLDGIFNGDALKPHLIKRGNTMSVRAACWRIASCVSVAQIAPLVVLWREQMDSVVEWPRQSDDEVQGYGQLLSAMVLCGIRWKIVPSLLAVVAGWADGAATGRRSAFVAGKRLKTSSSRKGTNKTKPSTRTASDSAGRATTRRTRKKSRTATDDSLKNDESDNNDNAAEEETILDEVRFNSLYALHALGTILTDPNDEFLAELHAAIATAPSSTNEDNGDSENGTNVNSRSHDQIKSSPGRLVTHMRRGVLGALDHLFEQLPNGATLEVVPDFGLLLRVLSAVLKASVGLALRREACSSEGELFDVREVIQWLTGAHLWANAARVHHLFAVSICTTCMGPLTDVAAIQKLSIGDARNLKTVFEKSNDFSCNLHTEEVGPLGRLAVEGLRLALHVDMYTDSGDDGFKQIASTIAKNCLCILQGVHIVDEDDDDNGDDDVYENDDDNANEDDEDVNKGEDDDAAVSSEKPEQFVMRELMHLTTGDKNEAKRVLKLVQDALSKEDGSDNVDENAGETVLRLVRKEACC